MARSDNRKFWRSRWAGSVGMETTWHTNAKGKQQEHTGLVDKMKRLYGKYDPAGRSTSAATSKATASKAGSVKAAPKASSDAATKATVSTTLGASWMDLMDNVIKGLGAQNNFTPLKVAARAETHAGMVLCEQLGAAETLDKGQGSLHYLKLFGLDQTNQTALDQMIYAAMPAIIEDHFQTFKGQTWVKSAVSEMMMPPSPTSGTPPPMSGAVCGETGSAKRPKKQQEMPTAGAAAPPLASTRRLDFSASARENRKCHILQALEAEAGWNNERFHGGSWAANVEGFTDADFELPPCWDTPYVGTEPTSSELSSITDRPLHCSNLPLRLPHQITPRSTATFSLFQSSSWLSQPPRLQTRPMARIARVVP